MSRLGTHSLWLLLMVLTGLAWLLGERGSGGAAIAALLLALAALKGGLVIDRFMGLAEVRPLWRWMVLGWLYLLVTLIGLAYWLGLQ